MIENYSRVVLVTDKYASSDGAPKGMIGYIVEVYENGRYEVEFSDPKTGVTLALFSLNEEDIQPMPEPDDPPKTE